LPVIKKPKLTKADDATAKLTLIAAGQPAAMQSNALMVEDEFNPFYMTGTNSLAGSILRPPYEGCVSHADVRLLRQASML
jgi:hypothetical protein